MPSSHQTLTLPKIRRGDSEEDTHTHREHMKERMTVEIDMNGKWVREGRVGGKIQSDDTDVMKNKGK